MFANSKLSCARIDCGELQYPDTARTTYDQLLLMLGEYELGDLDNVYCYVGSGWSLTLNTMYDFLELVEMMYGFGAAQFIGNMTIETLHGQRFSFVSFDQIDQPDARMSPCAYGALRTQSYDRIFVDTELTTTQLKRLRCLAPTGDMV